MSVNKIYYFLDPMCGWCYGFANQMQLLIKNHPDIPIEYICGGMILKDAEGPIGPKGAYIMNAIPRVEELSGVRFGDSYKSGIKNGTLWNGSFKPSVFVNVIKHHFPEETYPFFKKLQYSYFHNGQSLNDDSTYEMILNQLDLNTTEIMEFTRQPIWEKKTQEEFNFTSTIGISGFPTVVCERNDKLLLLSYGYSTYEAMEETLEKLMVPDEV